MNTGGYLVFTYLFISQVSQMLSEPRSGVRDATQEVVIHFNNKNVNK